MNDDDATTRPTPRVTSTDIARLKVGEKWGAYWKHADGWMRLYPPGGSAALSEPSRDEVEPHHDDAEEDARNWADDL